MRLDVCSAAVRLNYFPRALGPWQESRACLISEPLLLPCVDTFGIGDTEHCQTCMWRPEDGCCPIRYFIKFVDQSPQVKIATGHSAGNSTIWNLDPRMASFWMWLRQWFDYKQTLQTSQTQLNPCVCWIWSMLFSKAVQKEATLICMLWRLTVPGAGFLSCARRVAL